MLGAGVSEIRSSTTLDGRATPRFGGAAALTKGSCQIRGQRVARLRVAPQAGPLCGGLAGKPEGAAHSLVMPQEIACSTEAALLEKHLVLVGRAVLQLEHRRGQCVRGGRQSVAAKDQNVDHRWRQLAQLVADSADQ